MDENYIKLIKKVVQTKSLVCTTFFIVNLWIRFVQFQRLHLHELLR